MHWSPFPWLVRADVNNLPLLVVVGWSTLARSKSRGLRKMCGSRQMSRAGPFSLAWFVFEGFFLFIGFDRKQGIDFSISLLARCLQVQTIKREDWADRRPDGHEDT